jgi:hypothetical protein
MHCIYFSFAKSVVLNIKMNRGKERETLYIKDSTVSSIFRGRLENAATDIKDHNLF